MNVFICIATTINGLITTGIPHDEWISEASWDAYLERLRHTEIAIVGSKTYKFMTDEEFPPNLHYIVLTHQAENLKRRDNVIFSKEEPAVVIDRLRKEGYASVGVLGGSEVISSYLNVGVINELFIDIESIISGKGRNLIMPDVGIHRFELLNTKVLDASAVQLHYRLKG